VAASIAFVLLSDDPILSLSDIVADLRQTWPALSPSNPEAEEAMFSFGLAASHVVMGTVRSPFPGLEEPGAANWWLFPNAPPALELHSQHLLVTVFGDAPAIERVRLLTQVVAAVVATCEASAAVFWAPGGLVIRPDIFREFAVDVLPKQPPIDMWIARTASREPNGRSSGCTKGLAALGFMEIEAHDTPEEPAALRERLDSLIYYLIDNGR
jgi:hypothetical protein